MSDSIYVRLSNIMDDLARLARHVQPLEIQLALEHLVDRIENLVEETIGMETPHRGRNRASPGPLPPTLRRGHRPGPRPRYTGAVQRHLDGPDPGWCPGQVCVRLTLDAAIDTCHSSGLGGDDDG